MRFTLYTDYALRVLLYLGKRQDGLATVAEISRVYQISEHHLTKVVHNLGRDGYIQTIRGRNGGIRLAASPEDILIGDVVRRYEENFTLVDCLGSGPVTCPIVGACGLTSLFGDALEAFMHVLNEKSLADILAGSRTLGQRLKELA